MKQALIILILLGGLAGAPLALAQTGARQSAVEVLGDGPARLNVGLGFFNFDGGAPPAAARIEWRFGKKKFRLGPLLGVLANSDEGIFPYGGLYLDIAWRQFVLTPMSSIGAYCQGESKDLGGTLQFRSALEFAWQPAESTRLGVQLGHISNANLHHRNAGENDIFFTIALPF